MKHSKNSSDSDLHNLAPSATTTLPIEELERLRNASFLELFDLRPKDFILRSLPRLILKDGSSVSVQAHKYMYCTPKDDEGPYSTVEVGFPEPLPSESWDSYRENGIFANVPIFLVAAYIAGHGGIDGHATFPDGFSWPK